MVDTLWEWIGTPQLSENDTRVVHAVRELNPAKAYGILLAFLHHTNKSNSGDMITSMRGSTALPANFDQLLWFRRAKSKNASARVLEARGRLQGFPEVTSFDFIDDRYQIIGNDEAVTFRRAVLELKRILPRDRENAVTMSELIARTKLSRWSIRQGLPAVKAQTVKGDSSRWKPDRYYLPVGIPGLPGGIPPVVDSPVKITPLNNPPDTLKPPLASMGCVSGAATEGNLPGGKAQNGSPGKSIVDSQVEKTDGQVEALLHGRKVEPKAGLRRALAGDRKCSAMENYNR